MNIIKLPEPSISSNTSVEVALSKRRSVRDYKRNELELTEVSQLLWAAYGINEPGGKRTAPSARALYPLEIYLAAGSIKDVRPGIYKYYPKSHSIEQISDGDKRSAIAEASLDQTFIALAPAVIVLAAVYSRTTSVYGERGIRYVHMDTGHACQNIHLQAVSLGLDTVVVGAFSDSRIYSILNIQGNEIPLAIMPVG